MIVVSDTSPIRALWHIDQLSLLPRLFDRVLIPPAVVAELRVARTKLPALDVKDIPAVEMRAVAHTHLLERYAELLDPGESEAIALALEVGVRTILIDEHLGRQVVASLGLEALGALGVLLRAKAAGEIAAVEPLMTRLQREIDFRVSESLRRDVLRQAGED